jgi:RNA polymerase sigma-70 factor (ECF subfamily)
MIAPVIAAEDLTAQLAAALGDRAPEGLAAWLADGLAAVRARWPDAQPGPALAGYLAARVRGELARLRFDELFLAWWAASGDRAGIAAFEAAFAPDVDALVARFHKLPADELRQRLRIKLFLGTAAAPPALASYTGAGSLQGWLRVTAARAFVDAARAERRSRDDDLDPAALLGAASPRDHHAAGELSDAIRRAFAAAVAGLAPRERTFLRHATVDGLTLDQIAATYEVHRATVARTLKAARARLLAETRARAAAALGVPADDLAGALSLLDSKLDLSLSRVFADP